MGTDENALYAYDPVYVVPDVEDLGDDVPEWYEEGDGLTSEKVCEVERSARQIRKIFFAGITSSLLLLIALAIRDFIAGTVEDLFPKGGIKNRLLILIIVVVVALFLVLVIYEGEFDL